MWAMLLQLLLLGQLVGESWQLLRSNDIKLRHQRSSLSLMHARPITYAALEIPVSKRKPIEILVDERQEEVLGVLRKVVASGKKAKPEYIDELIQSQSAIPMSDIGALALYEENLLNHGESERRNFTRARNPFSNINTYVNVGTEEEPFFVKSSLATQANTPENREKLAKSLNGFHNLTKLLVVENKKNHAESIPLKLKEYDYPYYSTQWKKYVNMTIDYGAGTLSHAILQYWSKVDNGDCGKKDGKFQRRPGYLGSLAPPADETLATGAYMFPKRVLQPWPVIQEYPFYVRWPSPHPRVPSIMLMMARNGQYCDGAVTEIMDGAICKSSAADPIWAGRDQEARDTARMARFTQEGLAFDPTIQIPHPGMASWDQERGRLPFYRPDHGPTIPADELLPERDADFWAQVLPDVATAYDSTQHIPKRVVPVAEETEAFEEEFIRQQRAAKILNSFESSPWRQEERQVEELMEDNVQKKMQHLVRVLSQRRGSFESFYRDDMQNFLKTAEGEEHVENRERMLQLQRERYPDGVANETSLLFWLEGELGTSGKPMKSSTLEADSLLQKSRRKAIQLPRPTTASSKEAAMDNEDEKDSFMNVPSLLDVEDEMPVAMAALLPAEFNPLHHTEKKFSLEHSLQHAEHLLATIGVYPKKAKKPSKTKKIIVSEDNDEDDDDEDGDDYDFEEDDEEEDDSDEYDEEDDDDDDDEDEDEYDEEDDEDKTSIAAKNSAKEKNDDTYDRPPLQYNEEMLEDEDFIYTVPLYKKVPVEVILEDFYADLRHILETKDDAFDYYDNIRALVRAALRRRFPDLMDKGYEEFLDFLDEAGDDDKRETEHQRRRPLQRRFIEVESFLFDKLIPPAEQVMLTKFAQHSKEGKRTFLRDHHTLDRSEVAVPVTSVLHPALEVSLIASNLNMERQFVIDRRNAFIENEKKMRRVAEATDGRTKGRRTSIKYVVELTKVIEDISVEVTRDEAYRPNSKQRTKSLGKRGKKASVSSEDDIDADIDVDVDVEVDADIDVDADVGLDAE